jgi:hypothetical protein
MLAISGVALLAGPAQAEASGIPGPAVLGWTITPGYTIRYLDIDVIDRNTDTVARFTSSSDAGFSLDIQAPALMFDDIGLTLRAHAGTLELRDQIFHEGIPEGVDYQEHNIGTRVKVQYKYLMPVVFQQLGPIGRFGLGYGRWDISLSGDVLMSDDLNDVGSLEPAPLGGSTSDRGGVMFFWQSHFPFGMYELSLNDVEFSKGDFEFWLSEINFMFGYYFEL